MSKEEMIKQIALQCIEDQGKPPHTTMYRAGFKSGEDMEIFWQFFNELNPNRPDSMDVQV